LQILMKYLINMVKSFTVCGYESHEELGYFLNITHSKYGGSRVWFLDPDNNIMWKHREIVYLKENLKK